MSGHLDDSLRNRPPGPPDSPYIEGDMGAPSRAEWDASRGCAVCHGQKLSPTEGPDGTLMPRVCGACTPPPAMLIPSITFVQEGDTPITLRVCTVCGATVVDDPRDDGALLKLHTDWHKGSTDDNR
jgi:hypothetical protein